MTRMSVGRTVQSRIYRNGVLGKRPVVPVNPDSLAEAAEKAMSSEAWWYVAGSAGVDRTAAANRAAFEQWRIVPRMLVNISERDLGIELFGTKLPSPLLIAPIGVQSLMHHDADLATARAAAATKVPMIISTQASHSTEDICAEMGDAQRWYQLYWSSSRELAASMVQRAQKAGCSAIVVTLDTFMLGWRTHDLDLAFLPFARGAGIAQYTSDPVFMELVRERAALPRGESPKPTPEAIKSLISISRNHPGKFTDNLRSAEPRTAVETFLDVFSNPTLTWDDLGFLREHTKLPILLKGLQHRDDAAKALDAGMDGIIVSNHGGRQIDGAVGSLVALPEIVAEVNGRVPVLFDSGVRTGADVFKALALGATAVCIGRPYAYGLAVGGEAGVVEVLENLLAELDITMALSGCRSVADVTAEACLTRA